MHLQHSQLKLDDIPKINNNMSFNNTPFELSAETLEPNTHLRALYKGMMNSIIGKFAQRDHYPTTQYVSEAEQIDKIFLEGKEEITNFQTIGTDICELQTCPRLVSNKTNRKGNPIITAFVTSLSRIEMHKNILLLKAKEFRPLYTDTDSLAFIGKKGKPVPFEINGGLGYFKQEYKGELTGFCCIGKKSYSVSSSNEKTEMKICGLSFQSEKAQSAVTFSELETFLTTKVFPRAVPQSRTERITLPSERITLPFSIRKIVKNVRIPSTLNFNRSLRKKKNVSYTEPYGYVETDQPPHDK